MTNGIQAAGPIDKRWVQTIWPPYMERPLAGLELARGEVQGDTRGPGRGRNSINFQDSRFYAQKLSGRGKSV